MLLLLEDLRTTSQGYDQPGVPEGRRNQKKKKKRKRKRKRKKMKRKKKKKKKKAKKAMIMFRVIAPSIQRQGW